MSDFELIATSAVGLEAVVARELKALGYEPSITQTGRIAFHADEAEFLPLCQFLSLHLASTPETRPLRISTFGW